MTPYNWPGSNSIFIKGGEALLETRKEEIQNEMRKDGGGEKKWGGVSQVLNHLSGSAEAKCRSGW